MGLDFMFGMKTGSVLDLSTLGQWFGPRLPSPEYLCKPELSQLELHNGHHVWSILTTDFITLDHYGHQGNGHPTWRQEIFCMEHGVWIQKITFVGNMTTVKDLWDISSYMGENGWTWMSLKLKWYFKNNFFEILRSLCKFLNQYYLLNTVNYLTFCEYLFLQTSQIFQKDF